MTHGGLEGPLNQSRAMDSWIQSVDTIQPVDKTLTTIRRPGDPAPSLCSTGRCTPSNWLTATAAQLRLGRPQRWPWSSAKALPAVPNPPIPEDTSSQRVARGSLAWALIGNASGLRCHSTQPVHGSADCCWWQVPSLLPVNLHPINRPPSHLLKIHGTVCGKCSS